MKINQLRAAVRCTTALPLAFFLLIFGLKTATSQTSNPTQRHEHSHRCGLVHTAADDLHVAPPSSANIFSSSASSLATPDFDLAIEPSENGTLLYEPVASWTGGGVAKAQLSVVLRILNKESGFNIYLKKVEFVYDKSGATVTKTFIPSPKLKCPPDEWTRWQNGREYHEIGDVVYWDAPFPTSITVNLYFEWYNDPFSVTMPLAPYNKTYDMPFRAFDLKNNEVWQGGSTHGGGPQVFAYDLTVEGLSNNVWSGLKPGTDGSENEHSRVWGKPVYAMADGIVVESVNNCPENAFPGDSAAYLDYPNGGGGNHFYIQHGENMALYAHFQKGSLNPDLLAEGSVVKKGDFLGLVGNSGSSSGPHLHIHIRKSTEIEIGQYRPLLFNTGWVIQKSYFPVLNNSANWTKLTAHGLPGLGGQRPFIFPSATKPKYFDYTYAGVWRMGAGQQALETGLSATALANKNNDYEDMGLRLTDLSVVKNGTSIEYSGVWRSGTGTTILQTGTTWTSFKLLYDILENQGLCLLDLEVFKDANGTLKYAGVFGTASWQQQIHQGKPLIGFNLLVNSLGNLGLRLVDVEVYNENGTTYYAGVWRTGSSNFVFAPATSWANFVDNWETLNDDGYRLIDLDTDKAGDNAVFAGTYLAVGGGYHLWKGTYNSIFSKWEHLYSHDNLRLIDFNVIPPNGASTLPGTDETFAAERDNDSDDASENLLFGPPEPSSLAAKTANFNFEMTVFPNPAADQFSIETDTEILGWSLANALGQTVASDNPAQTDRRASVPVSALQPGVYHLSVRTAKGIRTQKVEVLR